MSVPVTINNIVLLNLYVTKALHIRLGSASIGFVLPVVVFTAIKNLCLAVFFRTQY